MSNGANNFYKSDKVTVQKVTFKNQYQMYVAGNLFTQDRQFGIASVGCSTATAVFCRHAWSVEFDHFVIYTTAMDRFQRPVL
jgi:hypothetical protein